MQAHITQPNARCLSIRRGGGQYGGTHCTFSSGGVRLRTYLWTAALYEARARKNDGRLTWRFVRNVGRCVAGDRPSEKFIAEARELAFDFGVPFLLDAGHNKLV